MAKTDSTHEKIIWIDCEMTGLDLQRDALIEVAAVVTDSELQILGEGVDVLIKPPIETIENMSDVVREMHTTSGLLAELEHGITMVDAEEQVLSYVRQWVPEAGRAPLGGNSVSTDRTFLDRDMPHLAGHLHYRTIDVSSIKELAHRWFPRVYFNSPAKHGGHRALGDILDSIDELRYYRQVLFVPPPGPDTPTVRAAAHAIEESATQPRAAHPTTP